MDDTEEDARYPPNPYHQQGYGALSRQKLPVQNVLYSCPVGNQYVEDDTDDEDYEDKEQFVEEDDYNDDQSNDFRLVRKDYDDEEEENGLDDDHEDDHNNKIIYTGRKIDDVKSKRHPKKRKLKSLISSYEFAPRIPSSSAAPSAPKPSSGGRNSLTDWTEDETLALLDAWGDQFFQHGRKSLRFEEWKEVVEKVSEVSKIERTDTQCRNRVDTLKKKYKKEKMKLAETGGGISKWVYFKKMDKLMSSPSEQGGLSCGLDSGEYVFKNPRVYLNHVNGLDEMKDSPGSSEATGEEDYSDELPPKKRKYGRDNDEGSSFILIADSIKKFSEIYEKIESNKRKQMVELERMRMDFHRELEMQKSQILERAQAEITKIRQGEEEERDDSAENAER